MGIEVTQEMVDAAQKAIWATPVNLHFLQHVNAYRAAAELDKSRLEPLPANVDDLGDFISNLCGDSNDIARAILAKFGQQAPKAVDREGLIQALMNGPKFTLSQEFARWAADAAIAYLGAHAVDVEAIKQEAREEVKSSSSHQEAVNDAMDDGANFVIDTLAKAIGLQKVIVVGGSEEWEGDISATVYKALQDAGVLDEDNNVATHDNAKIQHGVPPKFVDLLNAVRKLTEGSTVHQPWSPNYTKLLLARDALADWNGSAEAPISELERGLIEATFSAFLNWKEDGFNRDEFHAPEIWDACEALFTARNPAPDPLEVARGKETSAKQTLDAGIAQFGVASAYDLEAWADARAEVKRLEKEAGE